MSQFCHVYIPQTNRIALPKLEKRNRQMCVANTIRKSPVMKLGFYTWLNDKLLLSCPFKDEISRYHEFIDRPQEEWVYLDTIIHSGLMKGYILTRDGRIWSPQYRREIIGSTLTDRRGGLRIEIHGKPYYMHRLVAMAFVPIEQRYLDAGETFNTLTVDHIDGNVTNNNWYNLRWCYDWENTHFYLDSDRSPENRSSQLTPELATRLCKMYAEGITPTEAHDILQQEGISVSLPTCHFLHRGHSWRNISKKYTWKINFQVVPTLEQYREILRLRQECNYSYSKIRSLLNLPRVTIRDVVHGVLTIEDCEDQHG